MPLLEFFEWAGPFFAYFSAFYGFFFWLYRDLEKSEFSRASIIARLKRDRKTYRKIITQALDWVDARLSADELKAHPPHRFRVTWSVGLLGFSLFVALAYPVLSLTLNWFFTGAADPGGLAIIPEEPRIWFRVLLAVALALPATLYLYGFKLSENPRLVVQLVAGFLLFLMAFAFAVAVAVAGAVAVAFAVAGAVAFAGAGAFAFAGAFAVAGAGAFAVAFAVAVAGAVAFAVAGAVAFAGAFAVAGAVAVALLTTYLIEKVQAKATLLFCWALLAITSIIGVVLWVPELVLTPGGEEPAGVILFVGLFPLVNGIFDYWSAAITRTALRYGLRYEWSFWLSSAIDLVCAMFLFFAVGTVFILLIHYVRPQDGIAMMDLQLLFEALRRNPKEHWWLFFMMFSTLIPTLVHFGIALCSTYTMTSWANGAIIDNLTRGAGGDVVAGRWGRMALTLQRSLMFFVPFCGALMLWEYGDHIIKFVIWVFENIALLLGAIEPRALK